MPEVGRWLHSEQLNQQGMLAPVIVFVWSDKCLLEQQRNTFGARIKIMWEEKLVDPPIDYIIEQLINSVPRGFVLIDNTTTLPRETMISLDLPSRLNGERLMQSQSHVENKTLNMLDFCCMG